MSSPALELRQEYLAVSSGPLVSHPKRKARTGRPTMYLVAAYMQEHPKIPLRAKEIAALLDLPVTSVQKVLQDLAHERSDVVSGQPLLRGQYMFIPGQGPGDLGIPRRKRGQTRADLAEVKQAPPEKAEPLSPPPFSVTAGVEAFYQEVARTASGKPIARNWEGIGFVLTEVE